MNEMPGFIAWQMISMPEAFLLRDYVKALGPDGTKLAERDPEGRELYEDNCAICHGSEGEGDQLTGSPRLNDAIWLYGSSDEEIFEQIARPRHGVMPAWEGRLGEATLKQLATFVHSLGGGE